MQKQSQIETQKQIMDFQKIQKQIQTNLKQTKEEEFEDELEDQIA